MGHLRSRTATSPTSSSSTVVLCACARPYGRCALTLEPHRLPASAPSLTRARSPFAFPGGGRWHRAPGLGYALLFCTALTPRATHPSQVLKPHQVEGVRWLFGAIDRGGGLLADDPGLGKTLQVIATVEALIAARLVASILVVAPANLLANWDAEFRRWLGGSAFRLNVTHLTKGSPNLAMSEHLDLLARTCAPAHSIVLISYEGLLKHGLGLCCGRGVDLLIADEAHCLAHAGARADAVRRTPARARLLVTATPLSNNLEELFQLYDLAIPAVLGTLATFRRDYARPIVAAAAEGCDEPAQALGEIAAEALAAIAAEVTWPVLVPALSCARRIPLRPAPRRVASRRPRPPTRSRSAFRPTDCLPPALDDAMSLTPFLRCSSDARAPWPTAGCPQSTQSCSPCGRRPHSGPWWACSGPGRLRARRTHSNA